MSQRIKEDICIAGAGISGLTAALYLGSRGIPAILIDKDIFPREKICGDGISGQVVSVLNRIDPGLISELGKQEFITPSWGMRFFSPSLKNVALAFKKDTSGLPPGFVCRRVHLDNFLMERLKLFPSIRILQGFKADSASRENGHLLIQNSTREISVECKLLLIGTGSDDKLYRQVEEKPFPPGESGIGVRAYYENVKSFSPENYIELHFLKELSPWYLWIFPFNDGSANVGLALPESLARTQAKSLKELLADLISKYPHLRQRFEGASLSGKIGAHKLPFYTAPLKIAGDNYLLMGDNARLIDPFTGEGMGNAALSGSLAAAAAIECLQSGNFSYQKTSAYKKIVYQKMKKELVLGSKLQKLARRPFLINLVIGRAAGNIHIRNLLTDMIYNQDTKAKLRNPMFYIKLLLKI